MKEEKALEIITKNHKSYNTIASDFDATRLSYWPEFALLGKYVKEGGRMLDIGCGNGRLLKYLSYELRITNYEYIGIDQSEELIKIAREMRNAERGMPSCIMADFLVADVFNMPFGDSEFDVVAGIAFLHHIPGEESRSKVLREMYRVLRPGGILFFTNWNLWQWKLIKKYKFRLRDFIFSHNGLDAGDFWIPFQGRPRYYHHFTKLELIKLCKKAGLKSLDYKKGANNVMILRKGKI